MTATQTRPAPHTTDPHPQPGPTINGRSSNGRFAKDNPGGPGNPFYRKQAEFRRAVLELFTPEDVMSLLRVMLALGRNGDVAAAKVFLEYVVGKPHKAPDPDREEHHERELIAEAPHLADTTSLIEDGIPADLANDAARAAVPVEQAAPMPEETATATPPDGQRGREVLRLLTATLRAAVANGVNGESPEQYRRVFDRLAADNGSGRTVPTADNGPGPTVATADNGNRTGRMMWPGGPAGPNGSFGSRQE